MKTVDVERVLRRALREPGALRIITSVLDPNGRPVLHNVVDIEPSSHGQLVATSAEGDWTSGYPEELLARLTEYRKMGGYE